MLITYRVIICSIQYSELIVLKRSTSVENQNRSFKDTIYLFINSLTANK